MVLDARELDKERNRFALTQANTIKLHIPL